MGETCSTNMWSKKAYKVFTYKSELRMPLELKEKQFRLDYIFLQTKFWFVFVLNL